MNAMTATGEASFARAIDEKDLVSVVSSLDGFLEPYRPLMARAEQREHLGILVGGLLSDLERKSVEPIASRYQLPRRPLQRFVGEGAWIDDRIRERIQDEVAAELGDDQAVFVLDSSGFHKQGPDSVGVDRQWCGRLGKIDNCQLGYFLVYSAPKGAALVAAQLYLPKDWADDAERRAATYVPEGRRFLKGWEIADELVLNAEKRLPHAWVVGDDEFGRPSEFRDRLGDRGQSYLLEVPSNTRVRRPPHWPGRMSKWGTVRKRVKCQPPHKWKRVRLRDGEKGPIEVDVFTTRVETARKGQPPRLETLFIMRNPDRTRTWYFLANGDAPLDADLLAHVASHRHHIEQVFEAAKGEVGLDHYEVRSWVGWHHHMTLSMLAHWFLVTQRRRLGKKILN
jgi:SRSO17 transposase